MNPLWEFLVTVTAGTGLWLVTVMAIARYLDY